MRLIHRACTVALTLGLAVAGSTAPATAAPNKLGGVVTVASGLDSPFGIDVFRDGLLVAESGAGRITYVDGKGRKRTVLTDVPGVAGVVGKGNTVYSVLGGADETGEAPAGAFEPTSVLRTDLRSGRTTAIANLEDYELANNPDGQTQFVGGVPVDALSNPFAMTTSSRGLLVADGGANAVLLVHPRTGAVSTFFVPPTITSAETGCDEAENNAGTFGCDSVPTGVFVAHGNAYVSTLGSFAPGAGRIYQVDLRTRAVERTWDGLFAPTGVALGSDRSVYYSRVVTDQVVRIAPDGTETAAAVASPTGLDVRGGKLYASSGVPLGPGAVPGTVVQVGRAAFGPAGP